MNNKILVGYAVEAFFVAVLILKMSEYTIAQTMLHEYNTDNWTSCEEFLKNTTFDQESIIDKDWKIFFFWTFVEEISYNIRFSPANKILVDRFKVQLQEYDSSINWTRAEMFMETSIDFSALYLSTDVPGTFRIIPSLAFEMESVPVMTFALKVVEPGYLGILNCEYRLCYALAPIDKMPADKDVILAAQKIGFSGSRNRSYLIKYKKSSVAPYLEDDSDEDQQVEVDNYNIIGN